MSVVAGTGTVDGHDPMHAGAERHEPVGGGRHGVVGVLVRGGGRQDHDLIGVGGGQEPAVEVAPCRPRTSAHES